VVHWPPREPGRAVQYAGLGGLFRALTDGRTVYMSRAMRTGTGHPPPGTLPDSGFISRTRSGRDPGAGPLLQGSHAGVDVVVFHTGTRWSARRPILTPILERLLLAGPARGKVYEVYPARGLPRTPTRLGPLVRRSHRTDAELLSCGDSSRRALSVLIRLVDSRDGLPAAARTCFPSGGRAVTKSGLSSCPMNSASRLRRTSASAMTPLAESTM